jgi:glutamyl-tRNA synthetase
MQVRVRFCPSPTGYLHVGGVRTALYNWLFARHHQGVAVLRIEDTDVSRETVGAIDQIQRSLDWLGLEFDESPRGGGPHPPYLQSERLEVYRETAAALVAAGAAYPCYQTPEELEAARAVARETDDPASPTRAHRELTAAQIADYEAAGRRPVIRFKTPLGGTTEVVDLVRGHVSWENRLLGDHVLLRADGIATYQLANPLDDVHHGMTHVIRGDDLLSSTPRQKLLVAALGHDYPITAHLPQILGADKKRLSKRHGAASVEEFRDAGYVPEAVVNYLALVGWSYDDSTELMTVDELIERFTMDRVSTSPGVFDHQKLAWMNGVYLRALQPDDYAARLRTYLADRGSPIACREELAEAVPLVQEKIGALGEFEEFAGFLFHPVVYDDDAWQKVAALAEAPAILRATAQALETAPGFGVADVELALRGVAEELDLKPRVAFLPPRVAISGRTVSPGLFESIALLGREESAGRLRGALAHLERPPSNGPAPSGDA